MTTIFSPRVSVLMPVFNAERYLCEAIDSILTQSYSDFELVIADDCSTDASVHIISEYLKKDHRIRSFRNQKNEYIAQNRNILLREAKGIYIAWQDADDISMPDRIQKQVDFLDKHDDVAIVGGYLEFFAVQGVVSTRKYAQTDVQLRSRIFRYSPVAQPTAMIRKSCIDLVGIYNLDYPPAEDIEMSFRLGERWHFANIPAITLRYRLSDGSATYKNLRKIELSTLKARMRFWFSSSYHPTLGDLIYNVLQFISIYLVPVQLKIALFNLFRNSSNSI